MLLLAGRAVDISAPRNGVMLLFALDEKKRPLRHGNFRFCVVVG